MANKLVFCTFADSRLKRSLKRISRQAASLGAYDSIFAFDEAALSPSFVDRYRHVLVRGTRGFGYWAWKPQVVQQAFSQLEHGDVVHYADCGCWINDGGRQRFKEYLSLLKNTPSGILGYQIKSDGEHSLEGLTYPEHIWTKGDLFDYFRVRDQKHITHTEQIVTTSFFLRKDDSTIKFLDDWSGVWAEGLHLIDDSPSKSDNFPGFIEHRHDQSAFSILAKLSDAQTISHLELEYPVLVRGNNYLDGSSYYLDWNRLSASPVQARRDKDPGAMSKLGIRIYNKALKLLSPESFRRRKIWGLR